MTPFFGHSTPPRSKHQSEFEAAHVRSVAEVELAVANLSREPRSGLIAAADIFILAVREAILKAADQHRVPLISPYRQFVTEGSSDVLWA